MFVYVIVNSETLKIYIGQHKGTNLRKYLQTKLSDAVKGRGGSSHLYASMRKHSKDAWSIWPLISDLKSREECDHWERVLIEALNSQHSSVGYNICRGGEGGSGFAFGHTVTSSMRRKISQAQRGRKQSGEHLQKRVEGIKTWHLQHDPRSGRISVQSVVDMYLSGDSATSVGKKAGLSASVILKLLRRAGVPRRSLTESLRQAYASGRKNKKWGSRWPKK